MQLADLGPYLLGREDAIRRLAADRSAFVTGGVLTALTAVAREYDHLDLLSFTPYLVALGLSAAVATFITVTMWYGLWRRWPRDEAGRRAGPSLRTMIALVWLTAPLAWLYALPVELVFGELASAQLNLLFLGIVATWRVALMVRVIRVLTGLSRGEMMGILGMPVSFITYGAFALPGAYVIMHMGGFRDLRHDDVRETIGTIAVLLTYGSLLGFAVGLAALSSVRAATRPVTGFPATGAQGTPVAGLAALVVAWSVVVSPVQREVRAALQVDEAVRSADVGRAAAALAAFDPQRIPYRVELYPSGSFNDLAPMTGLVKQGLFDRLPPDHWYTARALGALEMTSDFTADHRDFRTLLDAIKSSPAARRWVLANPDRLDLLGRRAERERDDVRVEFGLPRPPPRKQEPVTFPDGAVGPSHGKPR